jgi:hypothetical protein
MKIAILGGTGHIGMGIALRIAMLGNEVIVGSRELEKANIKAREYRNILEQRGLEGDIIGMENGEAAREADISIFTIPYKYAYSTAESLRNFLRDKIVISPIVPMVKKGGFFLYDPPVEGSAAEKLASILTESKIVSALQTIPAKKFADLDAKFEWDVPVCSNDEDAKRITMKLIDRMEKLRALDAGPLVVSRLIESITPLLLNLMLQNKIKSLGVKFL